MFRVIKKRTGRIKGYYAPKGLAHQPEILLLLLFLGGLVLGTASLRRGEAHLQKALLTLFENYTAVRAQHTILQNFSASFLRHFILLLCMYGVGLCAVGVPILYAIPMLYGTGMGMVSTCLYHTYALKGIGYCALLLYPGTVISVCCVVFGCSVSIAMSGGILKGLLGGPKEEAPAFRPYTVRYLILTIVGCIAALAETVLYFLFSNYFQFS